MKYIKIKFVILKNLSGNKKNDNGHKLVTMLVNKFYLIHNSNTFSQISFSDGLPLRL